ncbi:hypothetical protein NHX12_005443, partial [Muraenolepis orangiensis]
GRAAGDFFPGVYILIAVGAVMMVVGFLGCYGAIQESQCLLGTFFACLVLLFACEVAAGIWGYMHKDTVTKEMTNFYDSMYEKVMSDTLATNKREAASTVLRGFHETNCHSRINELFNEKIYLIGIAALVVAVIIVSTATDSPKT